MCDVVSLRSLSLSHTHTHTQSLDGRLTKGKGDGHLVTVTGGELSVLGGQLSGGGLSEGELSAPHFHM